MNDYLEIQDLCNNLPKVKFDKSKLFKGLDDEEIENIYIKSLPDKNDIDKPKNT